MSAIKGHSDAKRLCVWLRLLSQTEKPRNEALSLTVCVSPSATITCYGYWTVFSRFTLWHGCQHACWALAWQGLPFFKFWPYQLPYFAGSLQMSLHFTLTSERFEAILSTLFCHFKGTVLGALLCEANQILVLTVCDFVCGIKPVQYVYRWQCFPHQPCTLHSSLQWGWLPLGQLSVATIEEPGAFF